MGWVTSPTLPDSTIIEPTDRFTADTANYLKVWEDIKNQGNNINTFVYPVIPSNSTPFIPFIPHMVGAIEGTTISAADFQTKYTDAMNSVGPRTLDIEFLEDENPYTGLTAMTQYESLDPIYKTAEDPTIKGSGGGLKNFGFGLDPTVSNFTPAVVTTALNGFVSSISNDIYVLSNSRIEDKLYNINGVPYTAVTISQYKNPASKTTVTIETGPYDDCTTAKANEGNSMGIPEDTSESVYTVTATTTSVTSGLQTGFESMGISFEEDGSVMIISSTGCTATDKFKYEICINTTINCG